MKGEIKQFFNNNMDNKFGKINIMIDSGIRGIHASASIESVYIALCGTRVMSVLTGQLSPEESDYFKNLIAKYVETFNVDTANIKLQ